LQFPVSSRIWYYVRTKRLDLGKTAGRVSLPEICRFFGIVIRMFAELGAPHHLPHFNTYYQLCTPVISDSDCGGERTAA
jgi:hypothetical protein